MVICGIDYSLTSPAVTIHTGTEWSVDNCKFFYIAKKDKNIIVDNQFYGMLYPGYTCDAHRYENLANWSLEKIQTHNTVKVFIEGYAFGAVGRVFQIAENAGMLKYSLWKKNVPFEVYAPTEIKKYATGKGNANKEKLYEAFFSETSLDLRKRLNIINANDWNPISDIVDSYYIAKLGFMKEKSNANHS